MKNQINTDLSNCLSLSKFVKSKILLKEIQGDVDIVYKDAIFKFYNIEK